MVKFYKVSSLLSELLVLVSIILVAASSTPAMQEYCDDKSFVPTCSALDEIIIMEQATYGRMRLGKC